MFKLIPLKREICSQFQEIISFSLKNTLPFFIFATPIVLIFTIMDTFYRDFNSQPLNTTEGSTEHELMFHSANLITNKEIVKPKVFGWSLFRTLGLLSQDGLSELFPKDLFPNIAQNSIYYLMSFLLGTFPLGVFAYGLIFGKFLEELDSVDELVGKGPTYTTADVESVGAVTITASETEAADPIIQEPTCFQKTITKFTEFRTFLTEMLSGCVFNTLLTTIIVFHIFLILLDQYGLEEQEKLSSFIKCANWYLEIAYIVELITKLIIIGPRKFYKSGKNKWDFWIISFIGFRAFVAFIIWMQDSDFDSALYSASYGVPIIMLRIVPRWKSLYLLYTISKHLIRDMKYFLPILALVFLIAFPFAGRGLFQEYFEGNFEQFANHEVPRWNFMDFGHSSVSVFRIIYGEWTELFLNCWVASSKEISGSIFCFIYYLIIIPMTTVLLMYSTIFMVIRILKRFEWLEDFVQREVAFSLCETNNTGIWYSSKQYLKEWKSKIHVTIPEIPGENSDPESGENFLRKSGRRILEHDGFKFFSIIMISLGSLSLGLELKFRMISSHILLVFSFSVEMIFIVFLIVTIILRVIAFGPTKNFTNPAFVFELVLAIDAFLTVCCFDYFSENFESQGILYIRIRCFRAFLLFNWISNLKATAKTLFKEIKSSFWFIMAVFFVWLYFDVIFLKTLKGVLWKCTDPSNPSQVFEHRIIKGKEECFANNYTWKNDYNSFDNVVKGMVTLIKIATLDGWTNVVESAADSRWYNSQPIRDSAFAHHWLFVLFSTFGVLFLACVIFGILIHTMLRNKDEGLFLSEGQYQSYLNLKLKHKPDLTNDQTKSALALQCNSIGILLLDFMSIVAQAYTSDLESQSINMGFQIVYHVCSVLLGIEILGKIIYLRRDFIDCGWNILDLILLVWSVTDFFVTGKIKPIPRILRLTHLYRFTPFCLLQFNNRMAIEKFIFSLKLSLPALTNLFVFLLINFYSFVILGISLFVKGYKYPQQNFGTFASAYSILFKTTFFTGWSSVVNEMSTADDIGSPQKGFWWNFYHYSQLVYAIYFISYIAITILIVLNMYAIVILEFGSQFSKRPENFFNEILKSTDYAVNEGDPPVEVLGFSASLKKARSARNSQSQVAPMEELRIEENQEEETKIEVDDDNTLEEPKEEEVASADV